jgi:G3E family GTPase
MPPSNKEKTLIPVTILTGFLGSGKTTMLNHILQDTTHGMKFAIVENEFGDIGVDEMVLTENINEEIIEVMNGCICCTVRGDLVVALKKLYQRVDQFDGIIIETTGLADPAPVCQTFFVDKDIQKLYTLDSVITVVDCKYIRERLDEQKPEGVENEAVEQIVFADKIILNKIDLAKDDADLVDIEKRLKALNPTAVIQRTSYSKIDPKDVLNLQAFELNRVLDFDPEFLGEDQEHQHDTSVTSMGVKFIGDVNHELLQSWIERLITQDGANLYRYKGVIAVKGMENKYVFQGVGMMFSGTFVEKKWQKGEPRESRFCFIGKNLDGEFYKSAFMACREDRPLRFKVGDVVEANVGQYMRGKIIRIWDQANAYRIELEDRNRNVWAPVDVDDYVRLPR